MATGDFSASPVWPWSWPAAISVDALPGAGFDRAPRIRAVRAKADAFVSGANMNRNFGAAHGPTGRRLPYVPGVRALQRRRAVGQRAARESPALQPQPLSPRVPGSPGRRAMAGAQDHLPSTHRLSPPCSSSPDRSRPAHGRPSTSPRSSRSPAAGRLRQLRADDALTERRRVRKPRDWAARPASRRRVRTPPDD